MKVPRFEDAVSVTCAHIDSAHLTELRVDFSAHRLRYISEDADTPELREAIRNHMVDTLRREVAECVGRTCTMRHGGWPDMYVCSECGAENRANPHGVPLRYCQMCGARVVE